MKSADRNSVRPAKDGKNGACELHYFARGEVVGSWRDQRPRTGHGLVHRRHGLALVNMSEMAAPAAAARPDGGANVVAAAMLRGSAAAAGGR